MKSEINTTISFELGPRDLSAVTVDGARKVKTGSYRVTVGTAAGNRGRRPSRTFAVTCPFTLPE